MTKCFHVSSQQKRQVYAKNLSMTEESLEAVPWVVTQRYKTI